MVSRAVEKAQKRVEEYNFGIRKNLLEYDQVMNIQRQRIYELRQGLLQGEQLEERFFEFYHQAVDDLVQRAAADGIRGEELATRNATGFAEESALPPLDAATVPVVEGGDACRDHLMGVVKAAFAERRGEFGDDIINQILRVVQLDVIDRRWKDHIDFMDGLRRGIGLESYGQKDPKMRFKEEGFRRFEQMMELIRHDIMRLFFRLQIVNRDAQAPARPGVPGMLEAGGFQPKGAANGDPVEGGTPTPLANPVPAPVPAAGHPGPDDPCPCGSGQAFRHCHGT